MSQQQKFGSMKDMYAQMKKIRDDSANILKRNNMTVQKCSQMELKLKEADRKHASLMARMLAMESAMKL